MELVVTKLVTADGHFSSSERFIEGLIEKVFLNEVSSNSSVSCGFALVCSVSVSVCF